MGIHLKDHGFSLLAPPKCASTSLKHLAFEIENGRVFEPYVHNGRTVHIHALYPSLPFEQERQRLTGQTLLAVVRDPITRILSCYTNRVLKHNELDRVALTDADRDAGLTERPSLEVFVRNIARYAELSGPIRHHSRPLSHFLGTDPQRFDGVFDISALDRLYARLRSIVGTAIPPLRHLQVTRAAPVTALTGDLADRVRDQFAEDYALFGSFMPGATHAATQGGAA